jgi:hypothetical protein
MSKNNVNPGQYKVAGRERQGEDIVHAREKTRASVTTHTERVQAGKSKPAGARATKKKS